MVHLAGGMTALWCGSLSFLVTQTDQRISLWFFVECKASAPLAVGSISINIEILEDLKMIWTDRWCVSWVASVKRKQRRPCKSPALSIWNYNPNQDSDWRHGYDGISCALSYLVSRRCFFEGFVAFTDFIQAESTFFVLASMTNISFPFANIRATQNNLNALKDFHKQEARIVEDMLPNLVYLMLIHFATLWKPVHTVYM